MLQPPLKTVWHFFTKVNIYFPSDPAIVLLDIYPKELKTYPHKNWHAGVWFVLFFFN